MEGICHTRTRDQATTTPTDHRLVKRIFRCSSSRFIVPPYQQSHSKPFVQNTQRSSPLMVHHAPEDASFPPFVLDSYRMLYVEKSG